MHEQSRIKWVLNLREGDNKNRNAQEPGNTANCSSKPWQVNQSTACCCKRHRIKSGSRGKTMEQAEDRKNSSEPQENADRIDYEVVNENGFEKTLLQGRRNK